MAYNKFTLDQLRQEYQLSITEQSQLFAHTTSAILSNFLQEALHKYKEVALRSGSEKARSELLIAPVLVEVYEQSQDFASLFSGIEFNVNKKKGLAGFCDFILTLSPNTPDIQAPIISIVEAKKEDIPAGIPQCIAELVAAQIFNTQRNVTLNTLYGIVTTGTEWKFLKLEGTQAIIDKDIYFLNDVEKIVGIILAMLKQEV